MRLQTRCRVENSQANGAESGRLEDLVPLGALLADLRSFGQADSIYRRALMEYRDVSPFALAWVCFQQFCCATEAGSNSAG
jgi:hypothetical protein